jgi:hypothetical protein
VRARQKGPRTAAPLIFTPLSRHLGAPAGPPLRAARSAPARLPRADTTRCPPPARPRPDAAPSGGRPLACLVSPSECFLQVKAPPNQQVACPFCKELGYAVVFRGKKARPPRHNAGRAYPPSDPALSTALTPAPTQSAEELQRELLEDQRVIEARIRARQAEQAASDRSRAAGTGSHSRTPSSSTVPVPGAANATSSPSAGCDATSSPTPPSTPLTALPMLSPGGTFRVSSSGAGSGSGVDERDEARRRAAFLASSGGGGGGGVAEADARRLGRLADYLPPALLARTRASDIDLEDLMLMEAIWRSLQTAPEGSLPNAATPAAAAPTAAPAGGARHSESESEGEEDENEEDFDDDATTEDGDYDEAAASTADASPNAPALSEADMQRAMSLPREPGMPDADVPRGPLSRRASDIGGPRPQMRRRSSAARADSELEQLRNWGSYATPAAAHAAEEEMMAMAMRLSLAESQPQPTPEADAAAAASPAAEPDPDAAAAVREPDPDAAVVASLVATAVTAAVAAADDAPPAAAA